MKQDRGCGKNKSKYGKTQHKFKTDSGQEFEHCPLSVAVKQKHTIYYENWKRYTDGFLPVAGGTLDQTMYFLDVVDTIESEVQEYRNEQIENG